MRYVLAAAAMIALTVGASAQIRPLPTQPDRVPIPAPSPSPVPERPVPNLPEVRTQSTIANPATRTERANTRVVSPAIVLLDNTNYREYDIRYIVPDIGNAKSVRLIVERAGMCGYRETAFDGSPTPPDSRDLKPMVRKCRAELARYAEAVAALTEAPAAHPDYYALRVDRYSRSQGMFRQYASQPVLAIVRGAPGARGGVRRYTLHLQAPPERAQRQGVDADGDGFDSIASGGTDCDDNDGNRSPGMAERPDADGYDEDCNWRTIGTLDLDGDGFTDMRIWNRRDDGGTPVRGRDCNDRDPRINPNAADDLRYDVDRNCDGDINPER